MVLIFVTRQAWQIRKDKVKAKKQAKDLTWVKDEDMPPLGVKVSAASRDPATIRGIQHRTCPEKLMRQELHRKRNQLKKLEAKQAAQGRLDKRSAVRMRTL